MEADPISRTEQMTKHASETRSPHIHVESRRARILESLNRIPEPIGADALPLTPEQLEFLSREGEDLYWNELAWEELTDEERVSGGHLTELVFPAFLAFIDGLLLDGAPSGKFGVPRPHPEVVERILLFLSDRYADATLNLEKGADSENLVWARAMTAHLIDLVLYRLYRLTQAEREALESRG
jgi:hypothetical protein